MTLRIEQRWVLVSDHDKDFGEELSRMFDETEPRIKNPDGSLSPPLGFLAAKANKIEPCVLSLDEIVYELRARMRYGKKITVPTLKRVIKEFAKDSRNNYALVRGGITRY